MSSKILAPNGRLLVKELEQENKTSGGVLLAANTTDVENKAKFGVVVEDAHVVIDSKTSLIKKGTSVYFNKFAGSVVYFNSEKYISLGFQDIVAFIE